MKFENTIKTLMRACDGFKTLALGLGLIMILTGCVGPSNQTPRITLNGFSHQIVALNTTYVDEGATAYSSIDGDITAHIVVTNTVNTAVLGSYSVTYNVTAPSGFVAYPAVRTVVVVALNDTGITACSDIVSSLPCLKVALGGQDAEFGRDAQAAAGNLRKEGGGSAGFDFIKLDAAGHPLANQAGSYAKTPWSCVLDRVTGLMWEVKTGAGLGGLQDANQTYSWFSTDPYTNGGNKGTPNGGICADGKRCDTENYALAVNTAGLCGFSDWQLPQKEQLRSIVDYSIALPGPAIDMGYFPNTQVGNYWSKTSSVSPNKWSIYFGNGFDSESFHDSSSYVRLVRGGRQY